jgi:hypothetical protein
MKTVFILAACVISVIKSFAQQPVQMIVYPGKGLDGLTLLVSDQSAVAKYRKLNYKIKKALNASDTLSKKPCKYRTLVYSNDSTGITFHFKSTCSRLRLHREVSLVLIQLKGNQNAGLQNGIMLGKSNRQNVIDAFGPSDSKNAQFLLYDKKGISFLFDKDLKLIEMEIFPPRL